MPAIKCFTNKIITEKELKSELGENASVVDFILPFDDGTVMVESKVRDVNEKNQYGDFIGDDLKKTQIHAIKQGLSTVSHICQGKLEKFSLNKNKNFFLIIVMPHQHYMGSGTDIYNLTGKKRIAEIQAKYPNSPLPLSNVISLTADGLDSLVVHVESRQLNVLEFLNKFKAAREKENALIPEQLLNPLLDESEITFPSYYNEVGEH